MPIERSSPGRVTFSWKSKASIYAFIFYAILTVNIFIVGSERIKVLQATKKFDDYIYGVLFIIFLIPHFWIPFVGWVTKIFYCTHTFFAFLVISISNYFLVIRESPMTLQTTKLTGELFKCAIFVSRERIWNFRVSKL
jgi:hypothetical protein